MMIYGKCTFDCLDLLVLMNSCKWHVVSAAGATVQVHPGWSVLISGEGMVDDLAGGAGLGATPAGA